MNNNFVVIMAGGVGSRFCPVSRSSYPKQFIDVLGIGKTLIQSTYERIVVESNNTLLICPRNAKQSVKQIVSDIKSTYGHEYV